MSARLHVGPTLEEMDGPTSHAAGSEAEKNFGDFGAGLSAFLVL